MRTRLQRYTIQLNAKCAYKWCKEKSLKSNHVLNSCALCSGWQGCKAVPSVRDYISRLHGDAKVELASRLVPPEMTEGANLSLNCLHSKLGIISCMAR